MTDEPLERLKHKLWLSEFKKTQTQKKSVRPIVGVVEQIVTRPRPIIVFVGEMLMRKQEHDFGKVRPNKPKMKLDIPAYIS